MIRSPNLLLLFSALVILVGANGSRSRNIPNIMNSVGKYKYSNMSKEDRCFAEVCWNLVKECEEMNEFEQAEVFHSLDLNLIFSSHLVS